MGRTEELQVGDPVVGGWVYVGLQPQETLDMLISSTAHSQPTYSTWLQLGHHLVGLY